MDESAFAEQAAQAKPKIHPESNLAVIARLDPGAADGYASAILTELAALSSGHTLGRVETTPDAAYSQLHALKNAAVPTGDPAVLELCARMLQATRLPRQHPELGEALRIVIEGLIECVEAYRRDLEPIVASVASNSTKLSGF